MQCVCICRILYQGRAQQDAYSRDGNNTYKSYKKNLPRRCLVLDILTAPCAPAAQAEAWPLLLARHDPGMLSRAATGSVRGTFAKVSRKLRCRRAKERKESCANMKRKSCRGQTVCRVVLRVCVFSQKNHSSPPNAGIFAFVDFGVGLP